jgi:hypothetical protein
MKLCPQGTQNGSHSQVALLWQGLEGLMDVRVTSLSCREGDCYSNPKHSVVLPQKHFCLG